MSRWIEREISLPIDTSPIEGMKNLDGNQIAARYKQEHTRDKKYPIISFPSGVERAISLRGEDENEPHIHVFGQLELPYHQNRDQAHDYIASIKDALKLHVSKIGENGLIITNSFTGRSYKLSYDDEAEHIADVELFPKYAMELVTGEIRAALPPLYTTEKQGKEAIAPVKYFTPDANWTWYPTEYDGQDIFFGLVSGLEVELGYFSRTELEGVRGGLNLPLERDLHYKPITIDELIQYHNNINE